MSYQSQEYYLRRAIEISKEARAAGNTPFGALLVNKDGDIVMEQGNIEITDKICTGHAEATLAARASHEFTKDYLWDCTLYTTAEPCAMCAGAMVLARLDRLWIGAMDPKNGACGSVFNVVQEERLNHRMEVETGILEAECGQILSDFFRNMRAVKARKRKLFRQRMTSPDNTDGGNN